MKKLIAGVVGASCLAFAPGARAASFPAGSLIIPMDTDYQDAGMLTAFGLVDKLLRAGVSVDWIINTTKTCTVTATTGNDTTYQCTPVDMTASATDFKTPATVITNHGYRGGPFVIDASQASTATPIIQAWQASNSNANTFTTVHVASATFAATISRVLTAAPRIAVLDDTNQQIAFGYLNAALIPDETGAAWSNTSVDLLTDTAVGGSTTDPHDGALFGGVSGGQPQYCEIMTMHWNVGTSTIPAAVAEMGSFLEYPVHVNAECQAVNAVEGEPPDGGLADFVTTAGFQWPAPAQPTYVQFSNSSLPFAQMDGPFQTTGGSEPAYALAPGSNYYNQDIVMIRGAGVGFGVQDLWMTGYPKGACDIGAESCNGLGKVSYLGGHQYQSKTPMTQNPQSQGARLFLNSLYEAGCVTTEGQPSIQLSKNAPTAVTSADVTYSITYTNNGYGPALGLVLTDPIPTGSTFVSASNGGKFANGTVSWTIGDVGKAALGTVTVTVALPGKGTYNNTAASTFKVGLNVMSAQSNQTTTVWGDCASDSDCAPALVCDTTSSTCVPCTASGCDGGGSSSDGGNATDAGGGGTDSGTSDAGSSDATVADASAADGGASSGGDATVESGSGSGGGDATAGDATSSSSSGSSSGTGSSGASSSGASSSGASSSGASSSGASGGSSGASGSGSGGTSSGTTSGGGATGDGGEDSSTPGASSGCGCAVPGTSSGDIGGGSLVALGLLLISRRRRGRAASR